MTKKEILRSIDSLIRDLDEWTTKRVKASLDKDDKAYQEAMFNLEGLAADSQQELTYLRDFINSLPEEPVSSIWHDASEKSDNPEDVVIINPSDNTGEVLTKCTGVNQGHIWAYTSDLLKIDNHCKIGKNLQEEPVSKDLEEAANKYAYDYTANDEGNGGDDWESDIAIAFKAGAMWQKAIDKKNESRKAL